MARSKLEIGMGEPAKKGSRDSWLPSFLLICFVAILALLLGPVRSAYRVARENAFLETGHTIYLYLFQYSIDHNDHCPSGSSSTEVFQKLIDGKYATDPRIFYLPMPGKTKPTSLHLKPENVSWDITIPVDWRSSENVPLIFCTGYRIEYKPGGRALPLPNRSRPAFDHVAMVNNRGAARLFQSGASPYSSIPNFIPANASLGTTTYTQLTPDGPLPQQ
jgi:hypothetical protein